MPQIIDADGAKLPGVIALIAQPVCSARSLWRQGARPGRPGSAAVTTIAFGPEASAESLHGGSEEAKPSVQDVDVISLGV